MKFLKKLIGQTDPDRNILQIIIWWEIRRVPYNILMLIAGMISLQIIDFAIEVPSGQDTVEPLAIIGFGLLCNLCYTLGWLTEIGMPKSTTYGPNTYLAGLIFSLSVALLPGLLHFIFWVGRGFESMYFG